MRLMRLKFSWFFFASNLYLVVLHLTSTFFQQMNKGKSHSSTTAKSPTNDGGKAGELFAAESLEEYAEFSRDNEDDDDSEDQVQVRN